MLLGEFSFTGEVVAQRADFDSGLAAVFEVDIQLLLFPYKEKRQGRDISLVGLKSPTATDFHTGGQSLPDVRENSVFHWPETLFIEGVFKLPNKAAVVMAWAELYWSSVPPQTQDPCQGP